MDLTLIISVVSLGIVGGLCTFGVFYSQYQENLLERVGASFIAIWCFARLDYKITTGIGTEPVHLFLHIGLALLFMGLAYSLHRRCVKSRFDDVKAFLSKHT